MNPLNIERRKLIGFVGIQTGFSSVRRRSALRSAWFPSDHEGLIRLAFFKAAFELFEADYHVKADDDIYLWPDRLATLLAKERTHSMMYIGCMKKGPVITDPKLKCHANDYANEKINGKFFHSGLCNPASKIKKLHSISMCSKSPTLSPEPPEPPEPPESPEYDGQ
ncbi:hypothetical protein Sjap_011640 [Stephania japonica]|uniref:Hexosyltransferase n=1 Tax=Stephania japonica TaxID=461633 RepID=A0AAP0P570_9MAGN